MRLLHMYKDADTGSGGGGAPTPQPSLADIADPNFKPADTVKPIIPEGGNPPIEGLDADGNILAGYEQKADGTVGKIETPTNTSEVEGVDKDGNIMEGYERLADGTVQKIGTSSEEGDDNPDTEEAEVFWNAVNAITGRQVDIDFGDVDPISPEGVALRENALVESTMKDFDQHLRESNPRAYAYFLHTQAGGTDDTFFGVGQPTIPAREDFESNVDAQASLLKKDYLTKGIPEEVAQATIDKFIKDNVLTEKALKLYDQYYEEDERQIKLMEAQAAKREQDFKQQVANFEKSIAETISSRVNLVIPETKKQAFNEFIKANLRHADGEFFFVQPIKQESLDKQIEAMYFQFVKGDLNSLIAKKAKEQTVQRLRTKLEKDKPKTSSLGEAPNSKLSLPLSQVN